MAAVDSMPFLRLTFQRTSSLSGNVVLATPVCRGSPRKRGQSASPPIGCTPDVASGTGGNNVSRLQEHRIKKARTMAEPSQVAFESRQHERRKHESKRIGDLYLR